MSSQSLELEDIGKVELVKSDKARYIRITVRPFKDVKVTVPRRASYEEAKIFVLERSSWIRKSKAKAEKLENKQTIFEVDTEFKTREHELELIASHSSKTHSRISNNKIKVYYPGLRDIRDDDIQEAIRSAIDEALRIEAKAHLPNRLAMLSYNKQFAFNRVFIKNTKSQWGSCSVENNINLSIHLMRLPEHLIDYVLLHELAHTIEKNHSRRFWALLDSVTDVSAKALDKELNDYQISIY